jgi:serine/threonine-protein kinase
MAKNNGYSIGDLDDGTWRRPAESDPTFSREDPRLEKRPNAGFSDEVQVPPRSTVPGPVSTPLLHSTSAGEDSADSDILGNGTSQQPAEGDPTVTREDPTLEKKPKAGSPEEEQVPPRSAVPGPDSTPLLDSTSAGEDSADSDILDSGTWQQPAEGDPTVAREDPTLEKKPNAGSPEEEQVPPRSTVPGPDLTPLLRSTPASRDSADSDESTPRPGDERASDWKRLPAPKLERGSVILEKYRLEERIGEGGMGEVWRVENLPLEKEVALKLIKPEFARNESGWLRFKREAKLMAKIQHPNVVDVYDLGRAQSLGYIEMEFVPGRSLEKYLKDKKKSPMPLPWTAQLLDQLCSVLHKAHGHVDKKSGKVKPIIHRDLKPSNLILVDGQPDGHNLKVLDFGIAKMIEDEAGPELTGQGVVVGTPYYMSPEQIRGGISKDGRGDIDGRSDLYSVGVLLYQLLTGRLPFSGRNNMEVLAAHLHQTPLPMKEANPAVKLPEAVEKVVMSCLERDPDRRPQSARELARRFQEAIGGTPTQLLDTAATTVGARRLTRLLQALGGILVVALLVFGVLVATMGPWGGTKKPPEIQPRQTDGKPLDPLSPTGYEPLDYVRVSQIARERSVSLETLPVDLSSDPVGLKRTSDNLVFYRFAQDVYLPLRYHPKDAKDLEGFWPTVLVRDTDGVQFIRISGGQFTRGDFRSPQVKVDGEGNPCTPHQVKVSDYYIQQTEVTNAEIKRFQRAYPDLDLGNWKASCDLLLNVLKRSQNEVDRCPAVGIDRETAQKYSLSVDGRLPTEAEWEYAARSRGLPNKWAWKNQKASRLGPIAHILAPLAADPFPVPVMTYEGEDETDQKVFDMTGNVREWCLDVYRPYAQIIAENPDPKMPLRDPREGSVGHVVSSKEMYVVRGGSFLLDSNRAMTFQRDSEEASLQNQDLGFRVVLECPALAKAADR